MSAYSHQRISHSAVASRDAGAQQAPIMNTAAKAVPFYTPEQDPPAGTAVKPSDGSSVPKLFTPLKIRGIVMPNRIWVSPMCQYSAHEGFHTPWHIAHYGGMAMRGPGLMMIEASAVQANGRITPEDSGIYLDAHIETLRKHVQFAHSQNALIGIQLAHAGRKASTVAPWLSAGDTAQPEAHGWPEDVVGPTSEPFTDTYPTPRSMSLQEIDQLKKDFVLAALRALEAGFDVIELHFAHGYLVSSFLSPAVNKRTDKYGGSFENRTRLALELVREVRKVLPEKTPLFVRISATDWLEENKDISESWTGDDSVRLAELFAQEGVDVLDVSTGGNHPAQKVKGGPGYQVKFAQAIKKAVGDKMLVSTVGSIKSGKQAQEIISEGQGLDLVAAGRMFQKNPGLVWAWADELDVSVQVAHQIGWGFGGRAAKKQEHVKLSIP